MQLYCMNCVNITDSIGNAIMSYNDVFKEIKLYPSCNGCGCKKCENIDGKYIDDLLNLFFLEVIIKNVAIIFKV